MDPLSFFRGADWRSAALALLLALPWLALLARGRLARPWLWAAVVGGAAIFPLSIAWVQVPIQQAVNALALGLFGGQPSQGILLLVGVPYVAVSGLVQEAAKLLIAALAILAASRGRGARGGETAAGEGAGGPAGLALGAAAGAGFGGLEAFWVFNAILASGISWGTVQLAGPLALLGVAERFITVPFHIAVAALTGYGYATGRPWRFFLLASLLHAAANYGAVLAQLGLIGALAVEGWVALVSAGAVAAALWLRARSATVTTGSPAV